MTVLSPDLARRLTTLRRHGGTAPEKPVLLLALVALAASGRLRENAVRYGPLLAEVFAATWQAVCPAPVGRLLYPFWHLERSLWQPVAVPGREAALAARRLGATPSPGRLAEEVACVRLAPDLFAALQTAEGRDAVRALVLAAHFPSASSGPVEAVEQFEHDVFRYEQDVQRLLTVAETPTLPAAPPLPVRSAAFRRLVTHAYGYTCAVSGLRLTTPEGANLVEAAHVHEWASSYDDRPQNGLALLPTLHWMFDRGLFTVSDDLRVTVSPHARDCAGDVDALLLRYDRQPVQLPDDPSLRPDHEALGWHRAHRFWT